MVEVFKTNVTCRTDADKALKELSIRFPNYIVHFDLADCDNILRVEGQRLDIEGVKSLLSSLSFSAIELLD